MKILDGYIGANLIKTILLVLFALFAVDLFFSFMQESRDIGTGNYDLLTGSVFAILSAVTKSYILFPWAALLGTLLGLGRFAKHSELIAMQTATISVYRIAWSVIKISMIMVVFVVIFGELVVPATEKYAQQMKTFAISGGQAVETPYGTWVRNDNEFIQIGALQSDGSINNVTRYLFDDQLNLQEVTIAKKATKNEAGWLLEDVYGTKFTKDRTEVIEKGQQQISKLLDLDVVEISSVRHLERLSIMDLHKAIEAGKTSELDVQEHQLAFWKKICQPFAILVMIYLAIPFVFGPLRSSSMGLKVVAAILVGISFHMLNSTFAPLTAVVGMPPFLAVFLPSIIFFLIGTFMVLRVR